MAPRLEYRHRPGADRPLVPRLRGIRTARQRRRSRRLHRRCPAAWSGMGGMKLHATPLAGLYEIGTSPVGDARGRFTRLFCEQELAAIRPGLHFTQINLSETRGLGALRGLHYQTPPAAEAKLIRCLRGRVFDVAVDLRAGSPTFLHWHVVELAEDNDRAIFIPEGFAHGFQILTDEAYLLYMHTAS